MKGPDNNAADDLIRIALINNTVIESDITRKKF